jgi:hypothetical protein
MRLESFIYVLTYTFNPTLKHNNIRFVDALMASFDYAHFFARMCDECRRQEREQPSQRK